MTDDIWKRDEIQSPCVKICVVHPESRLCIGCYRSLDEIRDWSRYTDSERTRLMSELSSRATQVKPKRRGGRGRKRP